MRRLHRVLSELTLPSFVWSIGVALHETASGMSDLHQSCRGGGRSSWIAERLRVLIQTSHDTLQAVITNMTSRLKDPDLARLFENTYPNTLGEFPKCRVSAEDGRLTIIL